MKLNVILAIKTYVELIIIGMFGLFKDLAVHTRVTPAQRQTAMRKFVDSVNKSPEATAALKTWGLEMDRSTVSVSNGA